MDERISEVVFQPKWVAWRKHPWTHEWESTGSADSPQVLRGRCPGNLILPAGEVPTDERPKRRA